MPAKLEPISKLNYAWPKGENDWNLGMDENLRRIGVLLQNGIESHTTQAPASPTAGKLYIVPPSATGAWAGKSGQIATWEPSAWFFVEPRDGMIMYNVNTKDILVYIGSAWLSVVATDPTYAAFKAAYDTFVTSVLQWRNHTYVNTQEMADLRTPKWYYDTYGLCTKDEFVQSNFIGLNLNWCTMSTKISHGGANNGYIKQVAYCRDNRILYRLSTSDTTWGAWVEMESVAGSASKVASVVPASRNILLRSKSGGVTHDISPDFDFTKVAIGQNVIVSFDIEIIAPVAAGSRNRIGYEIGVTSTGGLTYIGAWAEQAASLPVGKHHIVKINPISYPFTASPKTFTYYNQASGGNFTISNVMMAVGTVECSYQYAPEDIIAQTPSRAYGADYAGILAAAAIHKGAFGLTASSIGMSGSIEDGTGQAAFQMFPKSGASGVYVGLMKNGSNANVVHVFKTDRNTTIDANGFLKNASPIVKLYADHIELNEEALHQDITFERVAIGHYLVKGSSGFATDGWWFNVPVDSNGNKIVASTHETLDDGTLSIKTYKRKFDIETASIVPDLDNPIDIPANSLGESRWIDIRLIEIDLPLDPDDDVTESAE